jgi:hypothetical protein
MCSTVHISFFSGEVSYAHGTPRAYMHICHPSHSSTIRGSGHFDTLTPLAHSIKIVFFANPAPAPLRTQKQRRLTRRPTSGPLHLAATFALASGCRLRHRQPPPQATPNAASNLDKVLGLPTAAVIFQCSTTTRATLTRSLQVARVQDDDDEELYRLLASWNETRLSWSLDADSEARSGPRSSILKLASSSDISPPDAACFRRKLLLLFHPTTPTLLSHLLSFISQ